MRATVMYGAGDVRIENVPDPSIIEPTDAILRVVRASICGSDLWPYTSSAPGETGQSMGHEAIGVVEEIGADVRTVKRGDLVVMPFAISDGTCEFSVIADLQENPAPPMVSPRAWARLCAAKERPAKSSTQQGILAEGGMLARVGRPERQTHRCGHAVRACRAWLQASTAVEKTAFSAAGRRLKRRAYSPSASAAKAESPSKSAVTEFTHPTPCAFEFGNVDRPARSGDFAGQVAGLSPSSSMASSARAKSDDDSRHRRIVRGFTPAARAAARAHVVERERQEQERREVIEKVKDRAREDRDGRMRPVRPRARARGRAALRRVGSVS